MHATTPVRPRRPAAALGAAAAFAAAILVGSALGGCASRNSTPGSDIDKPYGGSDHPFAPNDAMLMDSHSVYRTMPPGD